MYVIDSNVVVNVVRLVWKCGDFADCVEFLDAGELADRLIEIEITALSLGCGLKYTVTEFDSFERTSYSRQVDFTSKEVSEYGK